MIHFHFSLGATERYFCWVYFTLLKRFLARAPPLCQHPGLPDIFFSPFLLQPHTVWLPHELLNMVYPGYSKLRQSATCFKGHRPSVAGSGRSPCFLSAVYTDSEASFWEHSLPHTRLHSAHIPAALSEEPSPVPPTTMLQWSCKGREEGRAGVSLLGAFSAQKNKYWSKR